MNKQEYKALKKELGIQLKEFREQKGLTIEELSKQSLLMPDTLEKIEKGRGWFINDRILILARLYGKNIKIEFD